MISPLPRLEKIHLQRLGEVERKPARWQLWGTCAQRRNGMRASGENPFIVAEIFAPRYSFSAVHNHGS
jgi:hypothetical protein